MKLSEIATLLSAKVLSGENLLDKDATDVCGSDMMSDVLAYVKNQSVMLTGLMNLQSLRTAQMMDMVCVVFVRGKIPSDLILEFAKENELVVMSTEKRMYEACGVLYHNNLGGYIQES